MSWTSEAGQGQCEPRAHRPPRPSSERTSYSEKQHLEFGSQSFESISHGYHSSTQHVVADSVDAHFQKSSLMDYLLDQRFDADMGASTIDGESGSFYIQTRDHDSPLIFAC